jgi:hypothetical protein
MLYHGRIIDRNKSRTVLLANRSPMIQRKLYYVSMALPGCFDEAMLSLKMPLHIPRLIYLLSTDERIHLDLHERQIALEGGTFPKSLYDQIISNLSFRYYYLVNQRIVIWADINIKLRDYYSMILPWNIVWVPSNLFFCCILPLPLLFLINTNSSHVDCSSFWAHNIFFISVFNHIWEWLQL